MKEGQFINNDKQRADHYFAETQKLADFLEYIFDTELDYITQSEMWDRFNHWRNEVENKPFD